MATKKTLKYGFHYTWKDILPRSEIIVVYATDLEEARDKTMMGLARRSKVIQPAEREMIAYHEAGHALLHYHLEHADPLHKVTIVPHGRALGVSFSLPENDMYTRGKGWLLDRITITMGGYAAEKLRYGENSTCLLYTSPSPRDRG